MGSREEDNKHRQIKEFAERCNFQDTEVKKLIEHGFTVPRMKVQANRLIALVRENAPQSVAQDAKGAEEVLKLIQRLGM